MPCHPVLLGNWATAVPGADNAPSWFSAWSMPSSPIQFVIAWLSQEQRSGP